MYHQDWLMRQIEILTHYIGSALFPKSVEPLVQLQTKATHNAQANELSIRLSALVREGLLCKAENLLYEAIEREDPLALQAGLDFYTACNRLSDSALAACDFPRDEILSGLQELCHIYGIDTALVDGLP